MEDILIPLFLGGITMMIPIVAILTHHQRKMAELVNRDKGGDPRLLDEVLRLREEVEALRRQQYETAIALDDLKGNQPHSQNPPQVPQLKDRLGGQ